MDVPAQASLASTLFFETHEEIYARVFRTLKPKSPVPPVKVEFCAFANANSFIRMANGTLEVRVTDVLQDAPAPVMEALATILISKLFRKVVPRASSYRYRQYLNRRDVRQRLHGIRRERGRKYLSGAQGHHFHLEQLFEDLNHRFFGGLMARPELGWSRRPSRTTLGHYDPVHHAIVISSFLDRAEVPLLAVEFVMFHEMLHLRYPAEHRGIRRCVHTPEFKAAEREFPHWQEARELLKRLNSL